MSWREWLTRAGGAVGLGRRDAELSQELRFHAEMLEERHRARGLDPAAARRAARLELGGDAQIADAWRDQRSLPMLDTLSQDIRYGVRMLRRAPGFTAVVLLTLSAGIGANTAIFTLVNAVVLRPLPYSDPAQLAMVWTDDPKHGVHEEGVSYPNYADWRRMNRSFADMAIVSRHAPATLTGSDTPVRVESATVSANLFAVLGVPAALGRTFSPEDTSRSTHAVVLSDQLWRQRFGGLPSAIGATLEIDGERWTVIGVMPPSFRFPDRDITFWRQITSVRMWRNVERERYSDWGRVVGRLKAGVTAAEALRDLSAAGRKLEAAYPPSGEDADFAGFGVSVVPLATQVTGRDLQLALWLLFGAVFVVLLIACANAANLLLARAAARQREIAVRHALGASRLRVVRQLFTESLMLATASGAIGFALAIWAVRVLVALAPGTLPRIDEIGVDGRALAATMLASALAAVLCGLVPALRVSASQAPGERTTTTSRRGAVALNGLVVFQIALSALLLCGAGLLIRSFRQAQAVDSGFKSDRVLTLRVDARGDSREFYRRLVDQVQTLPGVESAGVIEDVLQRRNPDYGIAIEGRREPPAEALSGDAASAGVFRALGVQLLKGRLFDVRDRGGPGVAVINQTMARHMWPDQDPIGRRYRAADAPPGEPFCTVIGVVSDLRRQGIERAPIAQMFWPIDQRPTGTMDLVVRTSGDPLPLVDAVRREIRAIDTRAPVFDIGTLERRLDASLSPRRFETILLGALAAIALTLAALGVFGVMHYTVAQRAREIGIRMALGATRGDVLALIVRRGGALTASGLAAGLLAARLAARLFAGLLFQVAPSDSLAFAGSIAAMAVAAGLASLIPAWRALGVDPLVALREE